jgi:uncharacterized protein (UPF0332 family)
MSHSTNKVDWCLQKAKRELAEKSTHRGLLEVAPDLEEAKKHVKKAEHNFKAVISMEKTGFSDWSVSAAFYTIYHCFLAIALKFGYESRNQECTIDLVESLRDQKKIEIDIEIINALKMDETEKHESSAIGLRESMQYGAETSIEDKTITDLKRLCQKAIEQTKKIIY